MKGVLLTPLKRIATPDGDVLHGMRVDDRGYAGFGEAYFSCVLPGAIKGWKKHREMTLNLVVSRGQIRFVIYDDRDGSETRGTFQQFFLSPDSNDTHSRLSIGPGLWFAFQGVGRDVNVVLNIANLPHDPAEAMTRPLAAIAWTW